VISLGHFNRVSSVSGVALRWRFDCCPSGAVSLRMITVDYEAQDFGLLVRAVNRK